MSSNRRISQVYPQLNEEMTQVDIRTNQNLQVQQPELRKSMTVIEYSQAPTNSEKQQVVLNKETINNLILNKLCFDNDIYYYNQKLNLKRSNLKQSNLKLSNLKLSNLKLSNNPEGENYQLICKQPVELTNEQKQNVETFDYYFSWLICSKKSNIFNIFFNLFLLYLIIALSGLIILPPLIIIIITSLYKKHSNKILGVEVFVFFQILFSSGFFYIYITYGFIDQQNQEFYGINALTFVGMLYSIASQAGIFIFLLNYDHQKKKYHVQTALQDLGYPNNQLYFETIDRSCIATFLEKKPDKTNIFLFAERFEHKISESLTLQSSGNLRKKVWNSGYYLVSHEQERKEKLFVLTDKYQYLCWILGFCCILIHFIYPIVYLIDKKENQFDEFNLSLIVLCNLFYSFFFILNCLISGLTYESFSIVETFTALLEIKNQMPDHEFLKQTPTLNLYCQTSIKTWFYMRQLMLNTNQFVFRFTNLLQSIDVICFLCLSSVLLMDFLGVMWSQNLLFQNSLLYTLLLSNLLLRLVLLITPIFVNFSYVNDLLLYNIQQIEKIIDRLQNISDDYISQRKLWQGKINNLQKSEYPNLDNEDLYKELINQSSSQLKDSMSDVIEIEQMRVIYEIQRNAELSAKPDVLQSTFKKINYTQLDDEQKIKSEIYYLSKLIKTYKQIFEKMKNNQDRNLLKFLGIIPISFGHAQTLIVLSLPLIYTIIIQIISQ